MKFYIHKTTSISVIDVKFHKNPLFCLWDFQFFQTAVTNLSYCQLLRYCQPFVQSLDFFNFHFQQDSVPAYSAREQVVLLSADTSNFISPLDWPPNSPDLNPVDSGIWGILQERVLLPDPWRRPTIRTTDWSVASFWSEHYWQSSESVAWSTAEMGTRERGTRRTSDLNILTVLTDISCAENSWLVGNAI